jgi:hypothetical protein
MDTQPPRILYRLVETNPPTVRDFFSHEELGKSPRRPLSRREQDRWRGLSHQDSLESALTKGLESPWLGNHVAKIHIPADAAIRIEQTGRDLSHYTVWADPEDMLAWVVSVTPVEPVH